jgi:hypothetical protein
VRDQVAGCLAALAGSGAHSNQRKLAAAGAVPLLMGRLADKVGR